MQPLFDKFGANATYVLSAIVVIVLLLALLLIVRAVFIGRVRPAGAGRARQPRLGVVDAFDLDRQRQLVLVRRDNVEHLIMIGGPNDVLVESSIVRAGEVRSGEPRGGETRTVETRARQPGYEDHPAAASPATTRKSHLPVLLTSLT